MGAALVFAGGRPATVEQLRDIAESVDAMKFATQADVRALAEIIDESLPASVRKEASCTSPVRWTHRVHRDPSGLIDYIKSIPEGAA